MLLITPLSRSETLQYVPSDAAPALENQRGGPERSIGANITLLVPEHPGVTLQLQPTLYWQVSAPVKVATLIISEQGQELLRKKLTDLKPGLQHFSLQGSAIKLSPAKTYQWAIHVAGEQGGADSAACAHILVQPGISSANVTELARRGIWYDALDLLSRQIIAQPESLVLRQNRAVLLRQVGLHDAARLDEQRLPLGLKVALSKITYRTGEPVKIGLSCEKPCFVIVVHVDAQGQRTQVLPNQWQNHTAIAAGQRIEFPSENSPLQLRVAAPFGKESFDIYASDVAMNDYPSISIEHGFSRVNPRQEQSFIHKLQSTRHKDRQFTMRRLSFDTKP